MWVKVHVQGYRYKYGYRYEYKYRYRYRHEYGCGHKYGYINKYVNTPADRKGYYKKIKS